MPDDSTCVQRRALPPGRQIGAILAVAVIGAGLLGLRSLLPHRTADAANASSPALPAGEVQLSSQQLATLGTASVTATPFHDAVVADGQIAVDGDTATQVFSPFTGRVVRVLANAGDRVLKGAPLLSLEASESLDARNALITAQAQERLAQLTETRRHAAYDSKGGSLQDWQQSQADLTAAQAALGAARGRLRVLGLTETQIHDLERAGTVEPTATITAPITGMVTDRQVGPGQVVQAGAATALFTVADLSQVWLLCAVRDVDAAAIAAGQEILIRVQALPGRDYRARVQSVGAEVDPATHRVMVRATVANPDGRLRPAMLATSQILTSPDTLAPGVPDSAIVREGSAAHVWVVGANGILQQRSIRTGRTQDSLTEVREGLAVGERIVTRGSLFIDTAANPD